MSEEQTSVVDESLQSESPTESNQSIELTVNDLSAIRQVIDIAQTRGAFKANEMVAVGTVYTKLDTFLNTVAAQQAAAQQTQAEKSGEENG